MSQGDFGNGRQIKINLGCGHDAPKSWINFDRSPMLLLRDHPWLAKVLRRLGVLTDDHMGHFGANIQRRDLAKPLPLGPGTVDVVYSSHMLEHLFLDDARALLREAQRVLRPGGRIRLALPDCEQWARELLAAGEDRGGSAGLRYHQMLRAYPPSKPTTRQLVAYTGGSNWHRWQPTRGLVTALLEEAGFHRVTEHSFQDGNIPEIELVEHRPDSMFFEAVRT